MIMDGVWGVDIRMYGQESPTVCNCQVAGVMGHPGGEGGGGERQGVKEEMTGGWGVRVACKSCRQQLAKCSAHI